MRSRLRPVHINQRSHDAALVRINSNAKLCKLQQKWEHVNKVKQRHDRQEMRRSPVTSGFPPSQVSSEVGAASQVDEVVLNRDIDGAQLS